MANGQGAFTGALAEQLLDNVLGIPDFIARGVEQGINLPRTLGVDPQSDMSQFLFGDLAEPLLGGTEITPHGQSPLGPLFDQLSGRNMLAIADSIPGVLDGQPFTDAHAGAVANRAAIAEGSPVAATLGGVAGDAATLMTGRAPRSGPGGIFDDSIAGLLDAASARFRPTATGANKQIKSIIDSDFVRDSLRGVGRAAETGLEGAALSIMQDGDPVETAALAAGGQLASSVALTAAAGSFGAVENIIAGATRDKLGGLTNKGLALAVTAGALGSLLNLFSDSPDAAEQAAFDKIKSTFAIGATLGLLGKRSKDGGILENFPTIADAVTTLPRSAMIDISQNLAESIDAQAVFSSIQSNPQAFTDEEVDQLMKSFEKGEFVKDAEQLMQDDRFRQRMIQPDYSDEQIQAILESVQ